MSEAGICPTGIVSGACFYLFVLILQRKPRRAIAIGSRFAPAGGIDHYQLDVSMPSAVMAETNAENPRLSPQRPLSTFHLRGDLAEEPSALSSSP